MATIVSAVILSWIASSSAVWPAKPHASTSIEPTVSSKCILQLLRSRHLSVERQSLPELVIIYINACIVWLLQICLMRGALEILSLLLRSLTRWYGGAHVRQR